MKRGTTLALAHIQEMEQKFDNSESNVASYRRLLRTITEKGAAHAVTKQSSGLDKLDELDCFARFGLLRRDDHWDREWREWRAFSRRVCRGAERENQDHSHRVVGQPGAV